MGWSFIRFYIFSTCLSGYLLLQLVESRQTFVWAIDNVGICNATCGPAVRNISFSCFNLDDIRNISTELAQTYPSIFMVKSSSISFRKDTSYCNELATPLLKTVECLGLPSCLPDIPTTLVSANTNNRYFVDWNFHSISRCSAMCNQPGLVNVSQSCHDRYNSGFVVKSHFCDVVGVPVDTIHIPCYQFSNCQPVWKAGPWSSCSRKCGLGEVERSVDCRQLVKASNGVYYKLMKNQCSSDLRRPHMKEYCLLEPECKPFYDIQPGKCMPKRTPPGVVLPCNETGWINNMVRCVKLKADLSTRYNATIPTSSSHCRQAGLKRPPMISNCALDKQTIQQKKIKCFDPQNKPKPMFELTHDLLVQMERRSKISIACGQIATIIRGTSISVICNVKNFKRKNLKWKKVGMNTYLPTFFQCDITRFTLDHKKRCRYGCVCEGKLLMVKFNPKRHTGRYLVIAKNTTAVGVELRSQNAYDAFTKDYLPRLQYLYSEDDSSTSSSWSSSYQRDPTHSKTVWMLGKWDSCSVHCGSTGTQRREVTCEILKLHQYTVVNDSICLDKVGMKPTTVQKCGTEVCPVWKTGPWTKECLLTNCYASEMALQYRPVWCENVDGKRLKDISCEKDEMPLATRRCTNKLCKPAWFAGNWSSCSTSCGSYGYQTREISCRWRMTGHNAGYACYKESLDMPTALQSCYVGPCDRLGCIDKSNWCGTYQASALCLHDSLRKVCCHTCDQYRSYILTKLTKRRSKYV